MTAPTLAELLARGRAETALRVTLKAARSAEQERKRKLKLGLSAPVFDINELSRRIEAEMLWRSISLVTIFNEQQCLCCGSITTSLQSTMVEQEHIRESGARRMLRSVESHPDLPRKRETWLEHIDLCTGCYKDSAPIPRIVPRPLIVRKDIKEAEPIRVSDAPQGTGDIKEEQS